MRATQKEVVKAQYEREHEHSASDHHDRHCRPGAFQPSWDQPELLEDHQVLIHLGASVASYQVQDDRRLGVDRPLGGDQEAGRVAACLERETVAPSSLLAGGSHRQRGDFKKKRDEERRASGGFYKGLSGWAGAPDKYWEAPGLSASEWRPRRLSVGDEEKDRSMDRRPLWSPALNAGLCLLRGGY
ncbi:uncharacterized protein N7483_008399 [Penicillium malachiteum]|uniref:uncharacterized protein n=1 Tax=Penicillium malachiteum TaxID=1324776 RepID=UPI002547A518|nr:uncharacterized protein N7483_008399 [Penicillium malachiteum]KAJ5720465.1 hypothetical protein N7483_008399 [Penicillium malachiteum]